MKKLLALLLAFAMLFCFVGCGSDNDKDDDDDRSSVSDKADKDDDKEEDTDTTKKSDKTEDTDKDNADTDDDSKNEATAFTIGKVNGNKYENTYLGIGFELPDGWEFYNEDMIAQQNGLKSADGVDLDEELEGSYLAYVMYATSESVSSVNINYENLKASNSEDLTALEYVEIAAPQLPTALEAQGFENVQYNVTTAEFAGKDHAVIALQSQYAGIDVYKALICIKVDHYIAIIAITTADTETLDAIAEDSFYAL